MYMVKPITYVYKNESNKTWFIQTNISQYYITQFKPRAISNASQNRNAISDGMLRVFKINQVLSWFKKKIHRYRRKKNFILIFFSLLKIRVYYMQKFIW